MDGFRRLYLDTNIFIAAFEGQGDLRTTLVNLLATSVSDAPYFVTSELSLLELLVNPYKDDNDVLIDEYERMIRSSDWLEVAPVLRVTLRYAAVLRAQNQGLKLPDAIHLSAAIGAGCSHFMTNDLGIKGTYNLVQNRYGMTRRASPLVVVRPDETTLASLIEGLSA